MEACSGQVQGAWQGARESKGNELAIELARLIPPKTVQPVRQRGPPRAAATSDQATEGQRSRLSRSRRRRPPGSTN